MKNQFRFLTALFALAIIFVSCASDDEPLPAPAIPIADYFPKGVGNYWIYEVAMTDSTNSIVDSTRTTDSVWTMPKIFLNEVECTPYNVMHKDGTEETNYFKGDSTTLFSLSSYVFFLLNRLPIPIPLPTDQWMKIADMYNSGEEKIFEQNFGDINVPIGGQSMLLEDVNYKITRQKTSSTFNVLVGTSTVKGYEFVLKHTITANTVLFGAISISPEVKYYYAGNIGLVQVLIAPFGVNSAPQFQSAINSMFPKQGYSLRLLRHYVK